MNKIRKLFYGVFNPLDLTIILTILYMMVLPISTVIYETVHEAVFKGASDLRIMYLKIFFLLYFTLAMWAFNIKDLQIRNFRLFEFILLLNIGIIIFFYIININPRPMFIISIIMIISIYFTYSKKFVNSNIVNLLIFILLIFIIAPIFFFPFQKYLHYQFNFADSFRGFSASRTDYGYLTSTIIILIIASNMHTKIKVFLFFIAFIPLAMSQSRAAFVSVVASGVMAVHWSGIDLKDLVRRWVMPIIICCIIFVTSILSSLRLEDLFSDRGGRLQLWVLSIKTIEQNFWFGSGDFYQQLLLPKSIIPIEPHNSILQSLINFGVIGTTLWYLLIYIHFSQLGWRGKIFIVNWFFFGMFQTSMDAYLFVPEGLVSLLLAVRLGSVKNNLSTGVLVK